MCEQCDNLVGELLVAHQNYEQAFRVIRKAVLSAGVTMAAMAAAEVQGALVDTNQYVGVKALASVLLGKECPNEWPVYDAVLPEQLDARLDAADSAVMTHDVIMAVSEDGLSVGFTANGDLGAAGFIVHTEQASLVLVGTTAQFVAIAELLQLKPSERRTTH